MGRSHGRRGLARRRARRLPALAGGDHARPSGRGPPAHRARGPDARVRRHAPALLPALAGPGRPPGPDAALHRSIPVPRGRASVEPAAGVPAAVPSLHRALGVRRPRRLQPARPAVVSRSRARRVRPGAPPHGGRRRSRRGRHRLRPAPGPDGPALRRPPGRVRHGPRPRHAVGPRRGAPRRPARGRRWAAASRSSRWPCWSPSTPISPSGSRSRTRPCVLVGRPAGRPPIAPLLVFVGPGGRRGGPGS